MIYRNMTVEILGSPGQYYWQICGTIDGMPYSERSEGTFTETIACAGLAKKAVNNALKAKK